jgi:alkaline phosphatase D
MALSRIRPSGQDRRGNAVLEVPMHRPPLLLPDRYRIDRRTFLLATAALAGAGLWSGGSAAEPVAQAPKLPAYPFQLGVASGDPAPDGMVLWTRLAPLPLEGGGMPAGPVEVAWLIADDEALTKVVQQGTVVARPEWAHSVHVEVSGLKPDRWYWYQFKVGGDVSAKGRTRTVPAADASPERLRFAFASCQHWENGLFTAYEHMIKEDLDLVVHLGDYIYEYGAQDKRVRKHLGPECTTLEGYRGRYAQYRTDPALQAMHAAVPWLVTPDDHEVEDNYASAVAGHYGTPTDVFLRRRAAAYQAYYEHMPLRAASLPKGPDMKLYRRVSYGRLADFAVLDTRQYRSDQPCGDGNKPPCGGEMEPTATLMGAAQRDWLFDGLARSTASWNVIAQQVMMAHVDRKQGEGVAYSMDQWPGYEVERRRVLKFLDERKVRNAVVLTGDIHTNWANDLIADFDGLDGRVVATEFVGSSISNGGDGIAKPKNLDLLLAENPFVKFHNAERGYVSCTLDAKTWRTDYRTLEYVSRPGSPLNTRASFVVEAGPPGLKPA